MISHCSSVTFMIDSRELRTRSKLASFLSALTAAKVTGLGQRLDRFDVYDK